MVPGKITPYRYGISAEKMERRKSICPTLEKKHHKIFSSIFLHRETILSKTVVKEQVVCAVDLGINTDAVCSIMCADGTILGRKFINFSSDKDQLYHVLGRIRRFKENIAPDRFKADGLMQKG